MTATEGYKKGLAKRDHWRRIGGKRPRTRWWLRYRKYIASFEWKVLKEEHLRRANFTCQRCGAQPGTGKLDVHHRNYGCLRREQPEDLEALCRDCHRAEHRKNF